METLRFERETVKFATIPNPGEVRKLEIAFCDVESLSGIQRFTNLGELQIHYCRSLADISDIGKVRSLTWINLYSLPNVEVGFCPTRLQNLTDLSYNAVRKLSSIRGIEDLKRLTHLGLSRVKVLDGDYMPIVRSTSLTRVFWFGAPFKPPALKELKKLRPDILIGGNNAQPSPAARKSP